MLWQVDKCFRVTTELWNAADSAKDTADLSHGEQIKIKSRKRLTTFGNESRYFLT
jgi:hypothetical protein